MTRKPNNNKRMKRFVLPISFFALLAMIVFSGCQTQGQQGKDSRNADDVTPTEAGAQSQAQNENAEENRAYVEAFSVEDFRAIEPYFAILLDAVFDKGNGSQDIKQMSVHEQVNLIQGYLKKKTENGGLAAEKVISDGELSKVFLSREEVKGILFSFTGQNYDDDLQEEIEVQDDGYLFVMEEGKPVASLEKPIITKQGDRMRMTAILCESTPFEISELADVSAFLVPSRQSEFGVYADRGDFDSSKFVSQLAADPAAMPEPKPRSEEELCRRALEHYEALNGEDEAFGASIREYDLEREEADITITYHIMDHYEVLEEYTVNPYTGTGSGMYEGFVDLR